MILAFIRSNDALVIEGSDNPLLHFHEIHRRDPDAQLIATVSGPAVFVLRDRLYQRFAALRKGQLPRFRLSPLLLRYAHAVRGKTVREASEILSELLTEEKRLAWRRLLVRHRGNITSASHEKGFSKQHGTHLTERFALTNFASQLRERAGQPVHGRPRSIPRKAIRRG